MTFMGIIMILQITISFFFLSYHYNFTNNHLPIFLHLSLFLHPSLSFSKDAITLHEKPFKAKFLKGVWNKTYFLNEVSFLEII